MARPNEADFTDAGTASFPALDRLRAALNARGARRHIFPLPGQAAIEWDTLPGALGVLPGDVLAVRLLEGEGDLLAAIVPGPARLALSLAADLLGARRVQLAGPRACRRWLDRFLGRESDRSKAGPLAWWEVPFLTGLPTILDSSLLGRDRLFAPTGEAKWMARLDAQDIVRVTNAHVGVIIAGQRAVRHGPDE